MNSFIVFCMPLRCHSTSWLCLPNDGFYLSFCSFSLPLNSVHYSIEWPSLWFWLLLDVVVDLNTGLSFTPSKSSLWTRSFLFKFPWTQTSVLDEILDGSKLGSIENWEFVICSYFCWCSVCKIRLKRLHIRIIAWKLRKWDDF